MTRKTYLLLICMMLCWDYVCSGKLVQTGWGNPKVNVKQDASQWTIRGERLTVVVDPNTLAMQIRDEDISWNTAGSTQGDLTIEHNGKNIPLCLKDAKQIKIEPYETGFMSGIKIQLNDYFHEDKLLKIHLKLNICLQTPNEDLVCELVATENTTAVVKKCLWPAPFEQASFDFTVVPLCRECCCRRNGRSAFGFMTQSLTGVVSICPGGATRKVILRRWLFLRRPLTAAAVFHILQAARRVLEPAGSIHLEDFHIRDGPDCVSSGRVTM